MPSQLRRRASTSPPEVERSTSRRRRRDVEEVDDTEEEIVDTDEDEEEDERPRRRRAASADSPRRASRNADMERSNTRRARRPAEDDEEDEAPRARPARRSREPERPKARTSDRFDEPKPSGWAGYAKAKSESSSFPSNFSPTSEQVLILFLEAEPFFSFHEHWVEEVEGRKSRTCPGKDKCPLCEIGERRNVRHAFNVIDWSDVDNPELKVWQVGATFIETIKNYADSKKSGPLNKPGMYWAVSKTGTKQKTSYDMSPVKERDLDEDWDRDPLEEDVIDEALDQLFDASYVRKESISELEELADKILALN